MPESVVEKEKVAMARDGSPPVDLAGMKEIVKGNTALLHRMIDHLFVNAPKQMAELEQAITAGDAAQVRKVAHCLKGMVASFGAENARLLAFELEKMGETGKLAGARETLQRLQEEMGQVRAALAAER